MPTSPPVIHVTTVSDTEATIHVIDSEEDSADGDGADGVRRVEVHRFDALPPGTDHRLDVDGVSVDIRTLPTPGGRLRSVFTTVNDVHFGETVAGRIDDHETGPLRRATTGSEPYPEVMNRAAVDEMAAISPDAVVVKGDLSLDGTAEEWAAFEACYRAPFGERLHVVRGNHDAYRHQIEYAGDEQIDLDGVTIALLDTVIPGATTGDITTEQADWLDALAATSTQPVFAMGHHQQWIADVDALPRKARRSDHYFGLHPDGSDRLDEVCARRPAIVAYASGHTHRHRVRTMTQAQIPSIEIGCTKDFPGTWAEYRVYDGAIMQVVHRMSSPEALAWSEPCRTLYRDFGVDYETYALGTISDRCFVIPTDRRPAS